MDEQQVRQLIRDELRDLLFSDKYNFSKNIQIQDGRSIQAGLSNGLKIGTATAQKLGFFNKTPIVQVSAITSPSGGVTIDSQARTAIDAIRTALTNLGLTA